MNQDLFNRVDAYLSGLLAPEDDALRLALERSAAAGLPAIHVAPNQGRLLQVLALSLGARRILEIGTLGGYSTIWLARGLAPGGKLISLEIDPHHARVARENLAYAGLDRCVDVRVGPAGASLEAMHAAGEAGVDLTFIDADKASTPLYLDWALRLARPGGLVVIDNVVRGGETADPATTDAGALGVRAALDRLAREPRVIATAVQTVGSKGHDGLALVHVRG